MALTYNFVPLYEGSGKLALSERPKLSEIKTLVPGKCGLVVTILSAKGEQAHKIGIHLENVGITWKWLKVANANSVTPQEEKDFKTALKVVMKAIAEKENVVIHCSGGRHRTGIFAYALLRKLHKSREEALDLIREIREETYQSLEERYLAIAEGFV